MKLCPGEDLFPDENQVSVSQVFIAVFYNVHKKVLQCLTFIAF